MREATLRELASLLGAELHGDPGLPISEVAELAEAGLDAIAPFTDPSRIEEARCCRAAALLVRQHHPELPHPQLVASDPRLALAMLLQRFGEPEPGRECRGVDARAVVEEGAAIDPSASVGPLCFVGAGARVGAGSRVLPLSYVGAGVQVGRECRIGPGATLLAGTSVADRVRVAAGAVVGSDGFGFCRAAGGWRRIPSRGRVHLAADVELGAGSCVDRATLGVTRIGRGSKIDNLVQVGHNAGIGEDALLCAQAGLAGSARLDDGCVLGGQVGVADHRRVGAGARVGGQAGVIRDIAAGARVTGTPAIEEQRWLRASVLFSRLSELEREVRRLQENVESLRKKGGG